LAEVVTPNLHEAAALAGEPVADLAEMRRAAERIGALGPHWVLIKGGHLTGDATDLLYDGETFTEFTAERIATPNTHGTGCTTASAIAALLAQGFEVPEAVRRAKGFITEAIRHALPLGGGHGPTNPLAWLKIGTASPQT
jgi:hydroxymethylpyrimidine/phosphomethylpyrimidine kinase